MITFADITAELAREAAFRARTFPSEVERGRMTQAEADWQTAIWKAIADDCARFAAAFPAHVNPLTLPAGHSFSWHERRAALLRELARRQRLYPQWIERGRITAADAALQQARLAACLAHYEDGLDWIPANGTPWSGAMASWTAPMHASYAEWSAVTAEAAARAGTAQEELAL